MRLYSVEHVEKICYNKDSKYKLKTKTKGEVNTMNEYLVNIEECCTGTKIYIGSPEDIEYYLNIVNADKLSDSQIKQIVKQLVLITEGKFLHEEGDCI